jgi:hypothetical protein
MKLANATELNRKSGVAQWRDLLCAYTPNKRPTSELANPAQAGSSSKTALSFPATTSIV